MRYCWRSSLFIFLAVISFTSGVTHSASASDSDEGDSRPNFIFMIGDDMAVETLNCYGVGSDAAHTPNLDNLCRQGLRFDNFWAQPVCSPTRATLLTGQYGFANGVGSPAGTIPGVDWSIPGQEAVQVNTRQGGMGGMAGAQVQASGTEVRQGLKADAYTFIQALSSSGYQTAAVGKWHLADENNGGLEHPLKIGFDHYSGSLRGGGVSTYNAWSKVVDGSEPFGKTGYVTSDTVDDGVSWLNQTDTSRPFFLWVAFNAPHTPFHMPPKELLSAKTASINPRSATAHQMYTAMIEAMDTEIGRLISSLDQETRERTYVVFMGDNGTPGQVEVTAPFARSQVKGSVYQGGVNVPFMVAGPDVGSGQVTKSLANSVDVFNTVLELTDVQPEKNTAMHSVSLTPILLQDVNADVRHFAYSDVFGPARNGSRDSRAIRNNEYKLIQHRLDGKEELYNLSIDPYENNNLLLNGLSESDKEGYDWLRQELAELAGE